MKINGNQVYVLRDERNPKTKRRLIEICSEPLRFHDIETNEWFNERAIRENFLFWSLVPYVSPKDNAKRITIGLAKSPLRVLWCIAWVLYLVLLLVALLLAPIQWLIIGSCFEPKNIGKKLKQLGNELYL